MSKKSKTKSNGSCLITCFKGLGILFLFAFGLAFGWVAGIIWFIFFRKKLNANPDKQKKLTIIVSILSVVSFLFLIYASFSTDIDQDNESNVSSATAVSEDSQSPTNSAEETFEIPVQDAIDIFVELYNSTAENPITDITELDIQGTDYRTEFRLHAFKNAVGIKGNIGNSNIDIVNYGSLSNDSIRFYATVNSIDSAIEICSSIIHVLDDTITDEEIKEVYDVLADVPYSNIYLGKSGYISGYINKKNGADSEYDVMIDCTKLNYISLTD